MIIGILISTLSAALFVIDPVKPNGEIPIELYGVTAKAAVLDHFSPE